jgi:uncharacterized protein (TIGR04255 family)
MGLSCPPQKKMNLSTSHIITGERTPPVKLDKDLLLDSVVEIRFVPKLPQEEVQTKIFEVLYKDFPYTKDVTVPPAEMRASEPFKYAITTFLHNNVFAIGFGSHAIVFNCVNGYKGWRDYFAMIEKYLEIFFSIGLFAEVVRIGVRYVNVFDTTTDLSKHIELDINFNNIAAYTSVHTALKLELKKNACQINLTIADTALVNGKPGSVLDIDVTKSNAGEAIFENICAQIQEVHREEKELFTNILDHQFMQTLGPTY